MFHLIDEPLFSDQDLLIHASTVSGPAALSEVVSVHVLEDSLFQRFWQLDLERVFGSGAAAELPEFRQFAAAVISDLSHALARRGYYACGDCRCDLTVHPPGLARIDEDGGQNPDEARSPGALRILVNLSTELRVIVFPRDGEPEVRLNMKPAWACLIPAHVPFYSSTAMMTGADVVLSLRVNIARG